MYLLNQNISPLFSGLPRILFSRKHRQNTQQYFSSLVQNLKFLTVNSYPRLTQNVRHCYSNFVFSKFLEALKILAQMRSISGN